MRTRCTLLTTLGTILIPIRVFALEIVVPTDYALIEDAVAAAAAGDTVTALAGEHPVYDFMLFEHGVVLRSLSGSAVTTLTKPGGYGVIWFGAGHGPSTVLQGFTFLGIDDGAIICSGASPTLRDLVFENCGVPSDHTWPGGAIHLQAGSDPIITNTVFRSCESRTGGAIYCSYSSPFLLNVRFEDCWGGKGGAVHAYGSQPTFIACSFIGNRTSTWYNWDDVHDMDGFGGAFFADGGLATFQNCLFHANTAHVWPGDPTEATGGAVYLLGAAQAQFTQTTFARNWADTQGGSIFLAEEAQASFDACIIAYTESAGGLVIDGPDASAGLTCSDVYGNADGNFIGMTDPTGADGNISAAPLFCDLESGDLHLAAPSPCLPANNSCGIQIGALPQGCESPTAVAGDLPPLPSVASVFPNPFNPATKISFTLPAAARVTLRIYDGSGRRVRTLLDAVSHASGEVLVSWDGADDSAQPLPSAVYLYEVTAGEFFACGKMTLLK